MKTEIEQQEIRNKVIALCKAEVGVSEYPKRSNMTKYGAWYGTDGVAWCGMFASWIYFMCGIVWPKRLDSVKGFSWVPTLLIRAKKNGWTTLQPMAGDLVIYDWEGNKEPDHVEIFEEWVEVGKTFKAFGGNVGNSVKHVTEPPRSIHQVSAFVNVIQFQ